ncbi:ABC transporter permease [Balneola sp. MJW-20]|uniref:ABC transporter permease n=1 Tax=Gracilimonas aurantiaca TaxID=3234185 RepID=UPI003467661B
MDLSKISLVTKREYLTRVRKKSFILSTILTPLAFAAFIGIVVWVTVSESEVEKTVGIVDQTGVLYNRLSDLNTSRYTDLSDVPLDSLRKRVLNGTLDAFLVLEQSLIDSAKSPTLIHGGSGGISFQAAVRGDLREVVREERLSSMDVSEEIRNIFETRPGLESLKLTDEGEEKDNTIFASAFGFILGLLIFGGIFGYGAILMRGIIEEKTNRIVEVIASSIRPIELLYGKLFGILMVAFTQFGIWILFYMGISVAAAPIAGMIMSAQMQNLPPEATEAASANFDPTMLEGLVVDPSIFVFFFIYFLLGLLIYSAVFAAIGSAVDSEQDTQQFMIPVMIPIFIGYFLNTKVIENPDSSIAIIASLVPFTSPINMISRIASTDVPIWQIGLSILLLMITFVGVMWLASKIYRVGILMYGNRPSYKDLVKWIRQD